MLLADALQFLPDVNQMVVSDYSRRVVADICEKSKNDIAYCSATIRTPADEAQAMYDNCRLHGVAAQIKTYSTHDGVPLPGVQVIQVFQARSLAGDTVENILAAMVAKILQLGASRVSHHCGDPALLNVLDFPILRLADPTSFKLAAQMDPRVSKFIPEPANDCYHMEIPQPGVSGVEGGFTSIDGSEKPAALVS